MSESISAAALKDELVRRRLIERDAGDVPAVTHDRPWFISIVLGASGWLAGVFVLIFVATLFKPDSAGGIALAGLVLLSAAFGLYAADRNSEFFDQLALALSIAGQLAMVSAIYDATDSATATAALTCAMQVVLLFVMTNPLAKVLAVFFACCAWALTVRFGWWGESSYNTVRHVTLMPALTGWFVVWLPIVGAIHALVKTEASWMAGAAQPIARAALIGLLVSLALATWLSEPFGSLMFWDEQRQINWMALWPLLGAMGALLGAVYAFRIRNRVLIGVAAVGALLHVGQFYYLLGVSLLIKSCIMLAVGVLALLAAAWLHGYGSRREVAT
jgi:hypothetical protein